MRRYLKGKIYIDGRNIPYSIFTAFDYLEIKYGWTEDYIDAWTEEGDNWGIYKLITQILALKQSCFLLRNTTYSCQSLSDGLYALKLRLIHELRNKYNFKFDDNLVERYLIY